MISDLYKTINYLDKISNNKYVYDTIMKLDFIYNYVENNKDNIEKSLIDEFEEMKKNATFNKYKFTTVKDLLNDIENDLYNILKKLQTISEDNFTHFACVKYFLKKEKILLALKSLLFLSKSKNNFYYMISLKLFKESIKDKKIPEEYLDKINEINSINNITEWENNDKIEKLKEKIYFEKKMGVVINDEQFIKDIIEVEDKNILRTEKNSKISELITFVSLFLDENGLNDLKKKLEDKMKIEGMDEDKIMENLTFYDDKKF